MPTEQTNLRLDSAIKAMAIAAAGAQDIPLARLVERALLAYLAGDSAVVAPGSSPDSAVVADLIARVERLERGATRGDSRADSRPDSEVVAPKAKHPPQHPTESGGLTVGAALIAAGAEITEAHALGPNRDERMRSRYGVKARDWLESQGWERRGRSWYPPPGDAAAAAVQVQPSP